MTEHNLCAPYVSALETPFLERLYQNPRRSPASTMLNMQQLCWCVDLLGRYVMTYRSTLVVFDISEPARQALQFPKTLRIEETARKRIGQHLGWCLTAVPSPCLRGNGLNHHQGYRMHPSIRSFPSSQFYQSMLKDKVSIHHRPQLNCIWPQKKERDGRNVDW